MGTSLHPEEAHRRGAVFWAAVAISVAFVLAGVLATDAFNSALNTVVTGMGIGSLFWGVGEPVLHYEHPPLGQAEASTPEAANLTLQYAFFHYVDPLHAGRMRERIGAVAGDGAAAAPVSLRLPPNDRAVGYGQVAAAPAREAGD